MTAPEGPSAGRIDELESIRGVAAFVVVVFHFPGWNSVLHSVPLIRHGSAMVDVFFVLSGFVICRIYGEHIRTPRDLLRFQLLRFGRLYPVHLLFLTVFLGLECLKLVLAATGLFAIQVPAFEANDGPALLANVLLIHAFMPAEWTGTFNGPSWTISVEFYCYLLFGGLVLFLNRFRRLIVASVALLGLANLTWPMIENYQVIRCLAGFFTGCVAAEICRARPAANWPGWTQGLAAAALLVFLWIMPRGFGHPLVGVALLTALLILTIVKGVDGPVRRVLRSPPLLWLGAVSYSLYMAHYLAIYVMAQLLLRFSPHPLAVVDDNALPQLPLWEAVIVYALLISAALGLSWLCWRWVERPCRALSRRLIFDNLGRFPDSAAGDGLKIASHRAQT